MFGRELKNLVLEGMLAGMVLLTSYSASFAYPPGSSNEPRLTTPSWPAKHGTVEETQGLPEDERDTLSSGV